MSESLNKNIKKPKYPVQTLEKSFEILDVLAKEESGNGLGISELSRQLDIGKSTVHRILDTLMSHEYVEKADNSKYRLSWRLFELGSVVPRQRTLDRLDLDLMEKLCEKHGETINLGARDRGEVIVVHKVEPDTALKVNFHVGGREPFYATAVGKVLFSEVNEELIREYLGDGSNIIKYTPNTVDSVEELLSDLERVRQQGYGFDDEEFTEGLSCIATPVRDYKGEIVAALSISAPAFRVTYNKLGQIKEDLMEVSQQFSKYLGYSEMAFKEKK